MKNFIYIITLVCFVLSFHPSDSMAQVSKDQNFEDVQKVAQAGYQFLKIGVSAREAGLGGAAITQEGNADAVFYNPAGLSSIEGTAVFAGMTSWIADINVQAASAVKSFGAIGVIGISVLNTDNGDIEGTAIANNNIGYEDTGMLDASEYALGLTYARRFSDRFGFGVTAKYCAQDLVARSSNVMAYDVGTIYDSKWNGVKIAMSIQHFATEIKYIDENFESPLTFRVGVSADLLSMAGISSEMHGLSLELEGVNPRDYSERIHLGGEYLFNDMIALRGGYKFNYDEESFSFGAGFKLLGAEFGYSYSDFGEIFSSINRISASLNF
jgi:hypothetical protein